LFFPEKEKEMGNGSLHPDERKLKERLGKDYEVETPPPGARVYGEDETEKEKEDSPAKTVGKGTES
jgi:hypothetical protein